jgi:hypothetical protein
MTVGAVVAAWMAIGLVGVGAVAAATFVSGSVAGAVTSVAGSTFTIKTTVTSTGSSKVKLSSNTAITKQAGGTRASLKRGDCVCASGTASGTLVEAAQVVITGTSSSQCSGGFGGGNGSRQPGNGGGFTPSGNGGIAFGTISAVNGSELTVTGRFGAKSVVVSSNTTIMKTVSATAAAVVLKECAFVRGTSSDGGLYRRGHERQSHPSDVERLQRSSRTIVITPRPGRSAREAAV